MVQDIQQQAEGRMQKTLEMLNHTFAKVRTGRAHPSLLESIMVSSYGNNMPLNQVASILAEDARTLCVTPWDKSVVAAIDKAIRSADLGLNPAVSGTVIRVPLPPLTEERRKELVRHLGKEAEEARVALRNIRRDANTAVKQLIKSKTITEDVERSAENVIQKLTDRFVAEVDKMLMQKEKELMQV
jgi:ribosome recycling factor